MPEPTTDWLAAQYRLGRFNIPNAHFLDPKEHQAVENAFKNLAVEKSDGLRMEKATFIDHIQSQLPLGLPAMFAKHLYRILAYHSTAPFYPSPSTAPPQSFSLVDIERALVWLLPDRHLIMSTWGTGGRARTPADQRRLLFQSLATRSVAITDSPKHEATRRRYALRYAFDAEHITKHCAIPSEDVNEDLALYCDTNRDEDGDEMYHDLLDVLHKNVPENYPYGTMRNDLRPLAKELKANFDFHNLAIPRAELTDFVRALMALQFEPDQSSTSPVDFQLYDKVVASIMATFICDDDDISTAFPLADDIVAWPAFDKALQRIPHLFDRVYRLLVSVFLKNQWVEGDPGPMYDVPPELQAKNADAEDPHILSLGWMALANAVIPPIVDFDTFHTVWRWRRSSGPATAVLGSDAIWAHIHPQTIEKNRDPPASILAFKGHAQGSGEQFRGGVLYASDNEGDRGDPTYSVHFFQLAPSVRYVKLLGQEWRHDSDGKLAFGDATNSSRFELRMDNMIEMGFPAIGLSQTIELDAIEVWKDGEE